MSFHPAFILWQSGTSSGLKSGLNKWMNFAKETYILRRPLLNQKQGVAPWH